MHVSGSFLFPLALVLLGRPSPQELEGKELTRDPDFGVPGWGLKKGAEEQDPERGTIWRLEGVTEPGDWSHVGRYFRSVPAERRLEFRVAVRGTAQGQSVSINAFALNGDLRSAVKSWSEASEIGSDGWSTLTRSFVLPEGIGDLSVWVINATADEVLVADPSLVVREAAEAPLENLTRAGVIRATANTVVTAPEGVAGKVWFPIPLLTDQQVPLTFTLEVDPPRALRGFRWVPREDGRNLLCEVDLAPEATATRVRWESLVLVDARADAPLPEADWEDPPEEARPWLRATAVVQSDDPGIRAKADELREASPTVGDFAKAVIRFTARNQGTGAPFVTLDARAALACGGSCTSRANLAAALLRAGGVPARTSAHLPTWSGPLYEHWHVEYWHPGAGWTWLEPTLGHVRPQPFTMVVLNVALPEDEDQGFDEVIGHSGVMLGVARHAVHEHSPELERWTGPGSRNGSSTRPARWSSSTVRPTNVPRSSRPPAKPGRRWRSAARQASPRPSGPQGSSGP